MPPKRMSDILHSSSIDARISSPLPTAITDTSDGPALPIIGAANEHASTKGTKRKRASNDVPKPEKSPVTEANGVRRENTNHPSLYEPWVLLPAKQRNDVEKQGTDKIEVVVYSRNQNVKSGISRLLRLVGAAPTAPDDEEKNVGKASEGGDAMVVLSAQIEGTVKLVGIVDMARRIAAQGGKGVRKEEGAKWCTYTVLSSVQMPQSEPSKTGGEDQEAEADAVDVDEGEEGGAVKETQRSEEGEMRRVPVLSVWMSRKRMAGWKEAFGEQEMVVYKTVG